jgi:predicted RNA-binding protein with PIN domain
MERLAASFAAPEMTGQTAVIKGKAPVEQMQGYQTEVMAYSKGHGSLQCTFAGYMPCHNPEEVIAQRGYHPELDMENPAGSVFCSHGAGFVVEWDQVEKYMHVDSVILQKREEAEPEYSETAEKTSAGMYERYSSISYSDDRELQQIFARTYGEKKERKFSSPTEYNYDKNTVYKPVTQEKEYLLVDGYNVIHAWDRLHELAELNLEAARAALMDILCNYQGYRSYQVILVFDAYKVKGNPGEVLRYHNIDVVYTKEAETADRYIEKTAHEIGSKYRVTVVTSDGVEQVIIRGAGCTLMSSREFKEDAELVNKKIHEELEDKKAGGRTYLFDSLDEELKMYLENVRLGKKL